jgi:hypothetical protein
LFEYCIVKYVYHYYYYHHHPPTPFKGGNKKITTSKKEQTLTAPSKGEIKKIILKRKNKYLPHLQRRERNATEQDLSYFQKKIQIVVLIYSHFKIFIFGKFIMNRKVF